MAFFSQKTNSSLQQSVTLKQQTKTKKGLNYYFKKQEQKAKSQGLG